MSHLRTAAARVAGLLVVNAALWFVEWGFALRVADDPMFAELKAESERPRGSSGGMTFDVRSCPGCPSYVLLGREIGNPGVTPYPILRVVNAPVLAMAVGKDLGFGIRELRPWPLVVGIVAEWVFVGVGWRNWSIARRRRAPHHEMGRAG